MPPWSTRIGIALFVAVLLAFAWSPVLGVGPAGEDLAALVDASEIELSLAGAEPPSVSAAEGARTGAEANGAGANGDAADAPLGTAEHLRRLYAAAGTRERPLAALSLVLSDRLWRGETAWTPRSVLLLRVESLVLLFLGAAFLGRFVRRALVPWTGRGQAAAAGFAVALLVAVHPLCLPLVASAAGRGDLLALVLGGAAGVAFLHGRQERRFAHTVLAAVLAIAAGFASELALFLPAGLAVTELFSGRRGRAQHVRLRTATTTFVVFAAAVGLETVPRGLVLASPTPPELLRAWQGIVGEAAWTRALASFGEKLGLLVLPVNAHAVGIFGFCLAGLVLLLALQPALVAARAAPRLWGWFHLGWFLSLVATTLPGVFVVVSPEDLRGAATLFAATVIVCVGLGVTATGLSGARRVALPLLVAAGYAVLTHAGTIPWLEGARQVERLRRDVAAAHGELGADVALLVVDPPASHSGIDLASAALPYLAEPIFTPPAGGVAPPRPRGLSAAALRSLLREPELEALRSRGLALLLPSALLDLHRLPAERNASAGGGRAAQRVAVRLPDAEPSAGPFLWREEGRSPVLDVDPLATRMLRVRAHPGSDTSQPPRLEWRAKSDLCQQGSLEGLWLTGPDGPEAWFDLESSLAWLVGQRIRRIWFPAGLDTLQSAELRAGPPELERVADPLLTEDGGWFFDPAPAPPLAGGLELSGARYHLTFLDLDLLEHADLPAEELMRAPTAQWRALVVPGCAPWLERAGDGSPVSWSLELRVDGLVLARTTGRR